MSVHGSRIFANWIKSVLVAGSVAAEIGVKPASVPTGAGWAVVYPIAGGVVEGTLDNPNEDATPDLQVTSVGTSAEQALWMVDRVRTLLLAATPATLTGGRRVLNVYIVWPDATLIRDDDTGGPPVWYCPDRFSYRTAAVTT